MNDYPNGSPRPASEDEHLRRLFDEAVSGVEPREALDSIHRRSNAHSRQHTRSWFLGTAGAVLATAATVAAVTVLGGDGTTGTSPRHEAGPAASAGVDGTTGTTPHATRSSSADSSTAAVPVYYVGQTSRGPRLFREFHRLDTGGNPLGAAVREALSGSPTDPDYRTDWPSGTVATAALDGSGQNGLISVDLRNDQTDLSARPAGMTADEASAAVQQLIYTAQAATQTRAPVRFSISGRGSGTDTVLGVPVSQPLPQGSAEDVLAQVWVTDPAEGAKVTAPFTVSGLAAAYEATVQWELQQGGRVVKEGFTTAEECCTMAPYTFQVDAPPGEYTLVVHDSDPSGGEGFAPWQDTKQVTVVP